MTGANRYTGSDGPNITEFFDALLPSKETLSGAYLELQTRIDQIVAQAEQQGSLNVAISGLNSIRQTLDSLARLAGHL